MSVAVVCSDTTQPSSCLVLGSMTIESAIIVRDCMKLITTLHDSHKQVFSLLDRSKGTTGIESRHTLFVILLLAKSIPMRGACIDELQRNQLTTVTMQRRPLLYKRYAPEHICSIQARSRPTVVRFSHCPCLTTTTSSILTPPTSQYSFSFSLSTNSEVQAPCSSINWGGK